MTTRPLGRDLILLASRLAVAAVFAVAAYDKIVAPAAFAKAVYNYRVIPGYLVNVVAVALPPIEMICAAFLAIGAWARGAALAASGMLVVFTAALISAAARGLSIDCGCFGSGHPVDAWAVARDVVIILPALLVLLSETDRFVLPRLLRHQ